MSRARPHLLLSLLTAACACTWSNLEHPVLVGVTPALAPLDLEVVITVDGRGFEPEVRVDFDSPGRSPIDSRFDVTLVAGATRVPLTAVARLSSTGLRATLAPGAPAAHYSVEVRDPRGRLAILPAAFRLFDPNTAPLARLAVSPGGGTAGATFTLDASASSDREDPFGALEFRFDSDGNGDWTAWSSSQTHDQPYASPGLYSAVVEVRDSGGRSSFATVLVVVASPGDEVPVTTAADEADVGATPEASGGAGLSLREAITWVNAQGTAKTITLAAPLSITMLGPQKDLTLTAPGAAIVAERGVVVDFGDLPQSCLTLGGPNQRLVGITLAGCKNTFIEMSSASGGSQVAHVDFQVTGTRYFAYGIWGRSSSAATSRIGPGNDLSGQWFGVVVDGVNYEVFLNRFRDNSTGASLSGGPARLWGNVLSGQVKGGSNKGIGVAVATGPGPVEILQNVFDGNAGDGVQAADGAELTVRNNLFTSSGGLGLNALPAGLTHDHNGYFGNAGGAVAPGLSTGPTDPLLDPLYVDGAGGDYRLLPESPAIDAGIDTGLDVNGPGPGLYDGPAPDLGASETP